MTCNYTTEEIHQNDIGVAFRATVTENSVAVDISTATTLQLIFQKPGGTSSTKTASFYTDGVDGIMQYISESGFLNESGKWRMQGYIYLSSSGVYHTETESFKVKANLT